MKRNIVKVALKNTLMYVIILIILSSSIAYLTLLISLNVKYAVDGILFNDYSSIPTYLNTFLKHDYKFNLSLIAIIIISISFIQWLLSYFRDRTTTKFKLKINTNLKSELYRHMLNLEYESYNSYSKTEMIQRINEDADVYSKFFNNQFNIILDIIFLSIFIMKESIVLNWQISIYIFLSIAIMVLFSFWYFKKLNTCIESMITKRKRLLDNTIRNINNFKFVRMFNKQKEEKESYKIANDNYASEEIKFIKLVLFYDIIIEHLAYLKSPIIYILGGIAIIKRKNDNGIINCFAYFSG